MPYFRGQDSVNVNWSKVGLFFFFFFNKKLAKYRQVDILVLYVVQPCVCYKNKTKLKDFIYIVFTKRI